MTQSLYLHKNGAKTKACYILGWYCKNFPYSILLLEFTASILAGVRKNFLYQISFEYYLPSVLKEAKHKHPA
jgi:hypothetical protein